MLYNVCKYIYMYLYLGIYIYIYLVVLYDMYNMYDILKIMLNKNICLYNII